MSLDVPEQAPDGWTSNVRASLMSLWRSYVPPFPEVRAEHDPKTSKDFTQQDCVDANIPSWQSSMYRVYGLPVAKDPVENAAGG